jgi:hypothetical protein
MNPGIVIERTYTLRVTGGFANEREKAHNIGWCLYQPCSIVFEFRGACRKKRYPALVPAGTLYVEAPEVIFLPPTVGSKHISSGKKTLDQNRLDEMQTIPARRC